MLPMLGAAGSMMGGGGGMSLDMGSNAESEGYASAHSVFSTGSFSVRGNAAGSSIDWMALALVGAALVGLAIIVRKL